MSLPQVELLTTISNTLTSILSKLDHLSTRVEVTNWPKTLSDEEHPDGELLIGNWPEEYPIVTNEPLETDVQNWPDTISDTSRPTGGIRVDFVAEPVTVEGTVSVSNEVEVSVANEVHVRVENSVTVKGDDDPLAHAVKVKGDLLGEPVRCHITNEDGIGVRNYDPDGDTPIPLLITGAVLIADPHGNPGTVKIADQPIEVNVVNHSPIDVHLSNPDSDPAKVLVTAVSPTAAMAVYTGAGSELSVFVENTVGVNLKQVDESITLPVHEVGVADVIVTNPVHVVVDAYHGTAIPVTLDGPIQSELVIMSKLEDGSWVHDPVNAALPLPTCVVGPDGDGSARPPVPLQLNHYDPNLQEWVQDTYMDGRTAEVYRHNNFPASRNTLATGNQT